MASHSATEIDAMTSISEMTGRAKLSRRVVRVRVEGRVQGVGFRMFVKTEAAARGLDGMVRNRRDGGVEAVFAGTSDIVEAIVEACRRGPRGARVDFIKVIDEVVEPANGFIIAETV
jgi:acylphosphatase